MFGDIVLGIFAASYWGYMAAVLDTWRPAFDRDMLSLPTAAMIAGDDRDFNPWATDPLPRLGGSAFFYPGGAGMAGVRVKPSTLGPNAFCAQMREKKDNAANGVVAAKSPPLTVNANVVKTALARVPDTRPSAILVHMVKGADFGSQQPTNHEVAKKLAIEAQWPRVTDRKTDDPATIREFGSRLK